ncbi:MAG: T9SS type A sorting domain-containing protein [Candidatus Cloacimonetes bacterium]|nr:T9SS type A sorting domain-containing protein [Candidatus Cloacimonadota bacterium]
MKKILFIPLLFLLITVLYSETISFNYDFEMPVVKTTEQYSELIYKNCYNFGDEGYPLMPHFGADILLPQNHQAISINIVSTEYYPIIENIIIKPAGKQIPLSSRTNGDYKVKPNTEIYSSSNRYPENIIENLNTHFLNGHSIASFTICPVSFFPETNKVKFLKNITVEIETETSKRALESGLFLKKADTVKQRLVNIIDNPEDISGYNYRPENRDEIYDILLITNNALLPAFNDYINFKESAGYIVATITTEDIYAQYTGQDEQEKIRNCIIDYYINYTISYVILGGDSAPNTPSDNIIPHRGFFADPGGGYEDYDIPADMYYCCLDGSWNDDGDNRWGEASEADLYAEIGIGRICADSSTEIINHTNKLFMYQNEPVVADIEKTLMVGEYLWPNTYGGQYKDEVALGSSNHGYTTAGVSANFTINRLYEMQANWEKTDIFNQFNNVGINLLNHLGHSFTDYNMKMYNSDVTTSNFQNDGITRGFVIGYSQGCYAGSFDNRNDTAGSYGSDCISERFTTLATSQAAFISNSRYGWGQQGSTNGPSQYFDRQFFDAIFDENITQIGNANNDSKEDNVAYINSQQVIRWCAYQLTLFGDPTMDIWTEQPSDINAVYDPGVPIGTTQITFQTDTPYARIGLIQNEELIGRGVADESGNIIIDLFDMLVNTEDIEISIIGHNKTRHLGTIEVLIDQPYVIYNSHQINDSAGNGNSVADFGENILLGVTLENIGTQTANNVNATLSSIDVYTSISDNSQVYGTIAAQSTSIQSDAFEFDIAGNIPDQHEIIFELEVSGSARDTWFSEFSVTVNAPAINFDDLTIDDAAGNGNGRLDPGETVQITFPICNDGHIDSPSATGVLNCTNQLVTIENDTVDLGVLAIGSMVYADFSVTADESIIAGTPISLTFEISAGEYIFEHDFVIPVGIVLEDFETGDFTAFSWQFAGDADWVINTNSYEGNYCAKSGSIDHNQETWLILEADVMFDDEISFYRKVSCEDVGSTSGNYYDYLSFYIDDTEMDKWAGEKPWEEVSFPVTAGSHSFKWRFIKDQGVVSGSDCVWIDYINFPALGNPSPPELIVNPLSFAVEMEENSTHTEILELSNQGGGFINYTLALSEPLDWIALGTDNGTLLTAELHEIDVNFDTNGIMPDEYTCQIIVTDNLRNETMIPVTLTVTETDAGNNLIPVVTELIGNYPNPFNPETTISFSINTENTENTEIMIYNIKGQIVRTLLDKEMEAGYHRILWNGKDNSGKSVSSGIYFTKFRAGNYSKTGKMILIK